MRGTMNLLVKAPLSSQIQWFFYFISQLHGLVNVNHQILRPPTGDAKQQNSPSTRPSRHLNWCCSPRLQAHDPHHVTSCRAQERAPPMMTAPTRRYRLRYCPVNRAAEGRFDAIRDYPHAPYVSSHHKPVPILQDH